MSPMPHSTHLQYLLVRKHINLIIQVDKTGLQRWGEKETPTNNARIPRRTQVTQSQQNRAPRHHRCLLLIRSNCFINAFILPFSK